MAAGPFTIGSYAFPPPLLLLLSFGPGEADCAGLVGDDGGAWSALIGERGWLSAGAGAAYEVGAAEYICVMFLRY